MHFLPISSTGLNSSTDLATMRCYWPHQSPNQTQFSTIADQLVLPHFHPLDNDFNSLVQSPFIVILHPKYSTQKSSHALKLMTSHGSQVCQHRRCLINRPMFHQRF